MMSSETIPKLEISVKEDGHIGEDGEPVWTSVWVEPEILKMSNTISNLIQDIDTSDAIPLDGIDKKTLEKIVEYCHLTKTNENSLWKKDYFNISTSELYHLTMGANFLDISELLDDATAAVAETFKGKTPEQIRESWHIPDDLSEDEKEQIRRENEFFLDL